MRRSRIFDGLAWSCAVLLAGACGSSGGDAHDAGDGGTDADTDADTDGDTDTGTETGTGDEECVPGGADSMVVDIPIDMSDPEGGVIAVSFATAEPVFVNVSTGTGEAQAQMFQTFVQLQRPIFAWIDPATRHVLDVIMPVEGPVMSLTPTDEAVEVALMASAAIHFLWSDNECFDHLYEELQAALDDESDVEVSDDSDDLGVVDVRPAFDL